MKNSHLFLLGVLLMLSGALGFIFSWYYNRPVTINDEMPLIHNPVKQLCQLEHDPAAGKKIFKLYCASCHAENPIIDIHAPRIGDFKAWQYRRHSGMEVLLKITQQGKKAMPARGGCFECTDKMLRQAIQYMLDNSK